MSLSMRSAGFARRDTTVRRDRSFPETARRAPTRMKPAGNLAGSVQRGEWGRGIPRGVRRMVSRRARCSSARSSQVLLVKGAGLVTLRTYPKFEGAISSSMLSNFHSKAVVSEERPRQVCFSRMLVTTPLTICKVACYSKTGLSLTLNPHASTTAYAQWRAGTFVRRKLRRRSTVLEEASVRLGR